MTPASYIGKAAELARRSEACMALKSTIFKANLQSPTSTTATTPTTR